MVTSNTISSVPTAAFSPDTRDSGYAYYVHPSGDIRISYDFNSYGSPGNGDMHSFNIYVNGDILEGGYAANIFRSYG